MPPNRQTVRPEDFELWPEHWDAWEVFLGCHSQWVVIAGMGGARYQGLNYSGVAMVMDAHRLKHRRRHTAFLQLQVLEEEALRVINNRLNS